MAYAAAISLNETLLEIGRSFHISVFPSSLGIIESAFETGLSLKKSLERLNDRNSSSSERLSALDGLIGDAISKIEDLIESRVSDLFLSQSDQCPGNEEGFDDWLDLEEARQEIYSLIESAKKMEEFIKELDNPSPQGKDDDEAVAISDFDFGVRMVGFSDDFSVIKDQVLRAKRPYDFTIFSFVGMAGSGRTFVAKALYQELYLGQEQSFDCGAWATVGPKYQLKEILIAILAQIREDPSGHDEAVALEGEDEEKLIEHLNTSLKGRKYMIVLDDICDVEIWKYLKRLFPEQDDGSLVLLTTREEIDLSHSTFISYEWPAIDDNSVWDHLCVAMFGKKPCPPELEEAGKKIAENCEGRRLALVKVVIYLLKGEKTQEYWNKLAEDKKNPIFWVDDELSEEPLLNSIHTTISSTFFVNRRIICSNFM